MLGDYLEPTLIQPTFIYDYPRDISPLAKSKPGDPTTVERFEGYIGGMELCNAFTELNDPLDQQARFEEMGRAYGDEDEDRHPMDEDYLQAMLYGMPPQGGFGMGVDRLDHAAHRQALHPRGAALPPPARAGRGEITPIRNIPAGMFLFSQLLPRKKVGITREGITATSRWECAYPPYIWRLPARLIFPLMFDKTITRR